MTKASVKVGLGYSKSDESDWSRNISAGLDAGPWTKAWWAAGVWAEEQQMQKLGGELDKLGRV
jgi:hypothetical protein